WPRMKPAMTGETMSVIAISDCVVPMTIPWRFCGTWTESAAKYVGRFHYDLHYINWYWARWLVGIAAMAMLVAILSGIVTHKKILTDFFLLRLGKGQRSWLDAHNASSVLFLPFILMITYTGLVSLATHYMPWGIAANYAD